jgi:hypothetical protein
MVNISNIPHILRYGIAHKNSVYADMGYVPIGNVSLIDVRSSKRVIVNNGDVFSNYGEIVLGDYIPFYFGVRMPMLYAIQHGVFLLGRLVLQKILYI